MAFPSIKINIGADVGKLKRDLAKGEGIVQSFNKAATRAFDGAVLAAGAFVTKVAIDSVKAASDLNETISKTNVIFGDSAKSLQTWAETNATAMGQTRIQALDAASTFATFGKQAGYTGEKLVKFSTDFTTLASDMASFNNTSPEDAIVALGAALRGESEPIRRYGVLLSDAAIQQEAGTNAAIRENKAFWATNGKRSVLNEQGKLLARYNIILKQTKDAQGDFARTSDGLANGQRILNATWDDAQAKIGEALLPTIKDLVNYANSPEGKKFLNDFAKGMSDAFKTAAEALPGIYDTLKKVGEVAGNMGIDFDSLMTPEVLAAAAAWRLTPGSAQFKGLAALAAYAAEKSSLAGEAQASKSFGDKDFWGKLNAIWSYGTQSAPLFNRHVPSLGEVMSGEYDAFGNKNYARGDAYNYYISGATDPQQTAIAVQRSIAKANRMKVGNNNAPATGF